MEFRSRNNSFCSITVMVWNFFCELDFIIYKSRRTNRLSVTGLFKGLGLSSVSNVFFYNQVFNYIVIFDCIGVDWYI